MRRSQQMRDRQAQRGFCERRQHARDPVQAPNTPDVSNGGCQSHDALCPAQARRNDRALCRGWNCREFGHGVGHDLIGTGSNDADDRGGFSERQVGEIGAVAAEGGEHGGYRRIGAEPSFLAANFTEALDKPRGRGLVVGRGPMGWEAEGSGGHACRRNQGCVERPEGWS